jgi:serine protease AprX
MSHSNERGAAERGLRSSALWGTGSRGGDSRSSVLWGKGGRGVVVTCVAVFALAAPLAATAAPSAHSAKGSSAAPTSTRSLLAGGNDGRRTYIARDLLDKAKHSPAEKVRVIIQSSAGVSGADSAYKGLGFAGRFAKRLGLVDGMAVELPARLVEKLSKVPGLTVTPDVVMRASDTGPSGVLNSLTSALWPYESGNAQLWGDDQRYAGKIPAIAIVDSGVEPRADFGSRLLTSVNMTTLSGNSAGDGRGHGTFVAGIAAGAGSNLAGAAPTAPIVSVDVMDDKGQALTSDVIAGAEWILANKGKYNIKVANFSLHSLRPSNFMNDPLDRAVEKLWFSGVTVVAAAGNYGLPTGPSGVKYAPGNDPFVITVGAVDLGGSFSSFDDSAAPWSAYGYTYDGFRKPEVAAPGRYMIGPVPASSTLAQERPEKMVGTSRIQLSGTSFAAPVVSGTAAQILARHPSWTPDQVKGALMATARPVRRTPAAAGLGQITAPAAIRLSAPPNPNRVLNKFLSSASSGGGLVFNALAWSDAAKASSSWNALAWTDLAWSDSNLAAMAWTDLAWTDMAWTDLSASDLAWSDMAWTDSSVEDAVEGDGTSDPGMYNADATDLAQAATDPTLQFTPLPLEAP